MRIDKMKTVFYAVALAAMLTGCALKDGERGFWDQQVITTAWGFTMVTPYGPFNFGYLSWQRNPKVILEAVNPGDVLRAIK